MLIDATAHCNYRISLVTPNGDEIDTGSCGMCQLVDAEIAAAKVARFLEAEQPGADWPEELADDWRYLVATGVDPARCRVVVVRWAGGDGGDAHFGYEIVSEIAAESRILG